MQEITISTSPVDHINDIEEAAETLRALAESHLVVMRQRVDYRRRRATFICNVVYPERFLSALKASPKARFFTVQEVGHVPS